MLIPLRLKSVPFPYTIFVCVLVPVYWVERGPANFLWLSDVALLAMVPAPGPVRLASVVRTCMRSRARVFMWTDIRPSSRDYMIGKMHASWYELVIRHAQGGRAQVLAESAGYQADAYEAVNDRLGKVFSNAVQPHVAAYVAEQGH